MQDADDFADPAYIEKVTLNDNRFRLIADAIAIESDLRDSPVLRTLMDATRLDADRAMRELMHISPADTAAIAAAQVRIRTFTYIRDTLDSIMHRGQMAQQELEQEDGY